MKHSAEVLEIMRRKGFFPFYMSERAMQRTFPMLPGRGFRSCGCHDGMMACIFFLGYEG